MIRGLYIASSGMQAQDHRMDALANNLANVDLNGYKRDVSIHKAFPEMLIRRMDDKPIYRLDIGSVDPSPVVGKIGTGVEYNESYTVFEQGSMKETGNPLDLALENEGFFAIQTPQGERYTRNGAFTLGKEGYILTKEGFPVLGEKGPLRIQANNFTIDVDGRVFHNNLLADDPSRMVAIDGNGWEDTQLIDRMKVVAFDRPRYLKKQGGSLWNSTEESGGAFIALGDKRPTVRQRFLEGANVNVVNEMVSMIEVNRAYEANQKVVQSQDSLLGKLINEIAKV